MVTPHLEALKAAAMADSIPANLTAMEELASIAGQFDVFSRSEARLLFISPVIHRHLDACNVPARPDTGNPDAHVQMAIFCLDILRYSHDAHRRGSSDVLIGLCQKKSILVWLEFFFDGWIEKKGPGDGDAEFSRRVWDTVTLFLSDLAIALAFRTTLDSVPDLTPMIARMWIKSAEVHHPMKIPNEAVNTIVTSFADDCPDNCLPRRKRFLYIIEGSRQNAASHIFDTLERLSQEPQIPYVTLSETMANTINLMAYSKAFFRSSLAAGSVKLIASMLARLTSHKQEIPAGPRNLIAAKSCLMWCAKFLEKCFADGPTWIAEALKNRLIISIFKSHDFLSSEFVEHRSQGLPPRSGLQNSYANLLDSVITHILYPSILREVHRSIITAEARSLSFDQETQSELSDAWHHLRQDAIRRWDWRSSIYQLSPINICSSKKCTNPAQVPTPTVRKRCCSRCRAVQYCSRKCQTADWRAGHRETCDLVLSRRSAGYPDSHTRQVLHFIEASVRFDIANNKVQLATALQADFSSGRSIFEPTVVQWDYRRIPVTPVSVRASEHVLAKGEDEFAWVRFLEDAAHKGHALVYATIPSGEAGPLDDPTLPGPLTFTIPFKF